MTQLTREQGDAIKKLDIAYGGVQVVPRREIKSGDLRMEYLTREGDLIIHFFWERPHPTQTGTRSLGEGFPEQPIYASWPAAFRETAWRHIVKHFRMETRETSVDVVWIPELFSFDATVKGIAMITDPSDSMMSRFIKELVELL